MTQPSEPGQWNPLIQRVKDLGPDMTHRTDAELRGMRDVLSGRVASGRVPEPAMAEAFAAVLEAALRTAGHSYRDSDIVAGAALYSGQVVQAEDNGNNHFIAVLPSYLCAVLGESVHYVTMSAALARRSCADTEHLCAALALRTRLFRETVVSPSDPGPATDIDLTYGSYQRLAVEYLGEHLAPGQTLAGGRQQVAIVDQIDAVLVDQATLPLVISAPRPADADFYRKICDAAAKLKRGRHYEINKATGMVSFSSDGLARGAELLRLDSVLSPAVSEPKRYLEDALRAREWYRLGKDYELAGMRVVPRVEPGSRLNDAPRLRNGIIQAIEAKEGLAASPEEAVWARITVSDYFQTYARLSGISGATARSAAEMTTIYGLATAVIPRDGALTRTDHPDLIFESAAARFQAMANDAADRHRAGQAVMVGVPTAADSALVGRLLADGQVAYPGHCCRARRKQRQTSWPRRVTLAR